MGIVNLAQLYGTGSYQYDRSFAYAYDQYGNSTFLSNSTGSTTYFNDNFATSYLRTGSWSSSATTFTISDGLKGIITFNNYYTITSIVLNGKIDDYNATNGRVLISYRDINNNEIILYNVSRRFDGLITLNEAITTNRITVYLTLSSNWGHDLRIREIQAFGPDIPTTRTRAYKDGIIYTFGKDVDAVSPLYIGGERIAIGATNHAMATPFRFYWDGDTYAILKAQGT